MKSRKLGNYKTCNNCRAMFCGSCGDLDKCILGYKLEWRNGPYGISIGYPGEPCPKPKTNMELVDSPSKWELQNGGAK